MQGKRSIETVPFSSVSLGTPSGTPRRTPPHTPRSELITQLDQLLSNLPVEIREKERQQASKRLTEDRERAEDTLDALQLQTRI